MALSVDFNRVKVISLRTVSSQTSRLAIMLSLLFFMFVAMFHYLCTRCSRKTQLIKQFFVQTCLFNPRVQILVPQAVTCLGVNENVMNTLYKIDENAMTPASHESCRSSSAVLFRLYWSLIPSGYHSSHWIFIPLYSKCNSDPSTNSTTFANKEEFICTVCLTVGKIMRRFSKPLSMVSCIPCEQSKSEVQNVLFSLWISLAMH